MNREKRSIIGYLKDERYGDLFGVQTPFRSITTKIVEKVVSDCKWFGFCTRINKEQVDIFSIKNSNDVSIGSMVANAVGTDEGYRNSLYRYLLCDYLCYYEAPTVIRSKNYAGFKDSYNKFLVTSNLLVIAEWLGITYDEAKMQYGSRFEDSSDGSCNYVKLTTAKDGTRKVTKPRKPLDLNISGLRIIPLFALDCGLKVLYNKSSKDFYNVTFIKDSGQRREINVCFDYEKLLSVYKDEGLLKDVYSEQYKGDLMTIKSLDRGYIRVIEVGTNIRNHASRSINIARIVGFQKAEPDLTFINVDLDTVKSTFLNTLSNTKVNYKELVDMLEVFNVGTNREYNDHNISSYFELSNWVETQEMLLSTPFIKQLALFMMGNPQWFKGYTGESVKEVQTDVIDDFDDDFDLDFDM